MNKEQKNKSEPIQVVIHDTARVQAVLKLASAIESLAKVLEGNTASVKIAHNQFEGGGITVHTAIQ